MKYIVIGAGSRGSIYGTWAHQNGIEIAAVAEIRPDRLAEAGKLWNVPENRLFTNVADLFALQGFKFSSSLNTTFGII